MNAEGNELFQKKPMLKSEDWWAVWLGLFVFALSLGPVIGMDLLGWVVKFNVWVDSSKALVPVSQTFQNMSGIYSAFLTYLFLLVITTIGAAAMGAKVKKYIIGFSVIFWISFLCLLFGNNAYIAATPDKQASLKIPWSMSLGEMGFVIAMIVGLYHWQLFRGLCQIFGGGGQARVVH